jgi:alkylation response protein AidB-like acyl-CoA dehydrogenase
MVKLYASEMANRVADRVVQIFGGRGCMRSNAAQRFFRELRVDRIWEGTSEIQRLIIARSVIKRGVEGVIGR